LASFGSEIGKITNRITAQFDVMAGFEPGTKERETLMYRIMCGQLFQQNAIDAAKGIVAKPVPKSWYSYQEAKKEGTESIVANRKPYFMRYVYPRENARLARFVKAAGVKCLWTTGRELADVLADPCTHKERMFVEMYKRYMPLSDGASVMNRLCHMAEREFGKMKVRYVRFDYRILQSGQPYPDCKQLEPLLREYNAELSQSAAEPMADSYAARMVKEDRIDRFRRKCEAVCSSERELCDALLEVCYRSNRTKQLVWDVCGEQIVRNLLAKNGWRYRYMERAKAWSDCIWYAGSWFRTKFRCLRGVEDVACVGREV
jgi:hypothetical protein